MACNTITLSNIGLPCLGQTPASIKNVWVVNRDNVTYGDDDVVMASGTTIPSKIVDLTLPSGTTFNSWSVAEQTTSYASTSTIEPSTNSVQYANTLSMQFFGMSEELRLQMLAATYNYLTVVFEDAVGNLWLMGYYNYVRATNNNSEIGMNMTDKNGYTLELTENSLYDSIPLVLTAERRTTLGLV